MPYSPGGSFPVWAFWYETREPIASHPLLSVMSNAAVRRMVEANDLRLGSARLWFRRPDFWAKLRSGTRQGRRAALVECSLRPAYFGEIDVGTALMEVCQTGKRRSLVRLGGMAIKLELIFFALLMGGVELPAITATATCSGAAGLGVVQIPAQEAGRMELSRLQMSLRRRNAPLQRRPRSWSVPAEADVERDRWWRSSVGAGRGGTSGKDAPSPSENVRSVQMSEALTE
jgi:hypothetical protein